MIGMDPVESLEAVLTLAKQRRSLGHTITMVRRIDESDQATLQRLIKERAAVVKLLRERGVRCEPFDHDYKYNFIELVEEHFGRDDLADRKGADE